MLCCGLLTLVLACAVGLWRRLRAIPRVLLALAATVLVAAPVLALSVGGQPEGMSRAEIIERTMHALCGRP
jgi:hypothetical protein